MRHPIKNKKKRIQICVTFLCSIATCGSAKKKHGIKKKTATNIVQMKMMIAHTARILPAMNLMVGILCIVSLIFLIKYASQLLEVLALQVVHLFY